MAKIELKNFYLENYNEYNNEHKSTMILIGNDKDSQKYLGNIDYMIHEIKRRRENNNTDEIYIVFENKKFADPIGFISVSIIDGLFEISYGILPKYRGKGYASKILGEFSQYLFKNYEIEDLYLQINKENEGSIKVALKNGFDNERLTKYHRGR